MAEQQLTQARTEPRRSPLQQALYWTRRGLWMELWGYVSIYRFLFRRPRVPRGAVPLTYHSPVIVVLSALLLMSAVELVVLDLLLRRWPGIRIAVLVLSAWGLVWMLGMLFGFLTRPHAVGPAGIRVRAGAEVDIALDWEKVESVAREKRTSPPKQSHLSIDANGSQALHLRIQDETTLDIELREPLEVRLPQGRATVSRIHVYADDPEAFMAAVAEHAPR